MTFVAPRNFKQGRLIFSRFRPIDLIILIATTLFSVVSIMIYSTAQESLNAIVILLLALPCALGFTLTLPCGLYHNFLVLLSELITFNLKNQVYVWEGIYKEDGKYEEE